MTQEIRCETLTGDTHDVELCVARAVAIGNHGVSYPYHTLVDLVIHEDATEWVVAFCTGLAGLLHGFLEVMAMVFGGGGRARKLRLLFCLLGVLGWCCGGRRGRGSGWLALLFLLPFLLHDPLAWLVLWGGWACDWGLGRGEVIFSG